ncbi:collagen binding domain-containing protein [Streptomyces sp. NPDC014894]|uniref:MSCRAMM family protein n=1 Tax=Streptomyces sp. NPDC014894 TaxID=3364931 RepID=UPI0037030A42
MPVAAAETAGPSPAPSSGTAQRDTPDPPPETGGIRILKKDPGGSLLHGAAFTLLDSTGNQAGTGTTDAAGQLVFQDLSPGVYRLKETSSGSPLHGIVADQDVIVPAGTTVPLTIVDPFKPANLTVKKTDRTSGKPLPGAVINIAPRSSGRAFTLTTGKDGTAKAALPVNTRTGTAYTVTETRAPAGYSPNPRPVRLSAKPGTAVTLSHTSVKKTAPATPSAKPPQTTPPTAKPPTTTPSPATTGGTTTPKLLQKTGTASASVSANPAATDATPHSGQPAERVQLARTGAAAPLLLGGSGLLLAAGAGAVIAARRRRTYQNHATTETDQN